MGTISPRVRRSATCTASWIFRISSAVNRLISPTPGSAAASKPSSPSAETATAPTGEPSEISSSPAREICQSATAGHPRERHRHDHDDDRSHAGQEPAGREGENKRHNAPDGAAFPVMADNDGRENADHKGQEEDAPRAVTGASGSTPFALCRGVSAFNRTENSLDAGRNAFGEIAVSEPGYHLLADDARGLGIRQRPFKAV